MELEQVDAKEAIKRLEARLNGANPTSHPAAIAEPKAEREQALGTAVAHYDYQDERGVVLYQTVRYDPKDFRQRRPDGNGGWVWNLVGVQRVLYRLADVIAADRADWVFVCEGEKDADRICNEGGTATTNPLGAGKWRDEYSAYLADRTVAIVADNDCPGRDHAQVVAASLLPGAAVVKIVDIPVMEKGADVSDFLDGDGSLSELLELAETTAPWQPEDSDDLPEHAKSLEPDEQSDAQSQRNRLLAIATECELFHDEFDQAHAAIEIDGHREIWGVDSRIFKSWLSREFYLKYGGVASGTTIADVLEVVKGEGRFGGPQRELHNRVARYDDAIYYDLTNDGWQAVRITPEAWQIVDRPPIIFRRYQHQREQLRPERGGDVRLLLKHLHVKGQDGLLVIVEMIAAFVPDIPHPIVNPHGQPGAAKTSLCKIRRRIIDPSELEVASFPRGRNDLVQFLAHSYAPTFDNVENLSREVSDVLCRAVTGEGYAKRALYTNDDDVIYTYQRCVALNGINVAAQRPDLLDRSILIELQPIQKSNRRLESELFAAFEADRPLILGAVFDVLSNAMSLLPQVELSSHSRMADFERWGVAISMAMGLEPEEFLAAYSANRSRQTREAIDGDPVAQAVQMMMGIEREWEGTGTQLSRTLEGVTGDLGLDTAAKYWPKSPSALSKRLKLVAGNLRDLGIDIEWSHSGERTIRIVSTAENAVQGVHRVQSRYGESDGKDGDIDMAEMPSNGLTGSADGIDGMDGSFATSTSPSAIDTYRDPNTGAEQEIPEGDELQL